MFLQDFVAFVWKNTSQIGLGLYDFFDYSKLTLTYGLKSTDYICDFKNMVVQNGITESNERDLEKFYQILSKYSIPLIVALISQLAEIGVRATFIIMSSTAVLLFDQLNQGIDDFVEKSTASNDSSDFHHQTEDLNQWKIHNDLVCLYTEQINRCFGISLLFICAVDFATPICEFQCILHHQGTNYRYYVYFIHSLLRFLLILISAHRVSSSV